MTAIQTITAINSYRTITQNNAPNNWSGYWEIDAITRTAVHKSGLAVVFDKKNPLVPISGRYVVDITGIASLTGTIWAGQAGALVEQAVNLWRGI